MQDKYFSYFWMVGTQSFLEIVCGSVYLFICLSVANTFWNDNLCLVADWYTDCQSTFGENPWTGFSRTFRISRLLPRLHRISLKFNFKIHAWKDDTDIKYMHIAKYRVFFFAILFIFTKVRFKNLYHKKSFAESRVLRCPKKDSTVLFCCCCFFLFLFGNCDSVCH